MACNSTDIQNKPQNYKFLKSAMTER